MLFVVEIFHEWSEYLDPGMEPLSLAYFDELTVLLNEDLLTTDLEPKTREGVSDVKHLFAIADDLSNLAQREIKLFQLADRYKFNELDKRNACGIWRALRTPYGWMRGDITVVSVSITRCPTTCGSSAESCNVIGVREAVPWERERLG